MAKFTRGQFIGRSAALMAGLGLGHGPTRAEATELLGGTPGDPLGDATPDLVLVNGRVYTVDDRLPRAEAFAVKDGRFVAVGSTDDVRNLVGRNTQVIDAGGMTVTPGFIDAHSHPASGGVRELTQVNLDVRTIDDIKQRIREEAATLPPGEWVIGFKYDDTKVVDRDGRYRRINRRDLDEAAPNHPVKVSHRGGHIAWYNSKAFELAGVTAETRPPAGGDIYVENGELTGLIAERANDLFDHLVPSGSTREERREGVKLISELMTATGLTSVHDTGVHSDGAIAYQDAYDSGEMRFRVYMLPRGGGDLFDGLKAAGISTGFGDEWLRVGAVKYGADGSASGRTMRMSTPYVGRPNDYGILTMTPEEVDEAVRDAKEHGFQIGIHVNGDVAIAMALDAYEKYLTPADRPRLEHATLVNPELLRRIKAIGAVPTPFWTYVHYHGNKWGEYGEDRLRSMFPHRYYLDYDIPVAGASDYVPGPYEPMMAIQSMVTRKDMQGREWGPNQKVSVEEALRIGTINGAYASFEEDIKGSITPGKLADFVVLAIDPHEEEPDRIKEIPVARTVVGGKTMHEG